MSVTSVRAIEESTYLRALPHLSLLSLLLSEIFGRIFLLLLLFFFKIFQFFSRFLTLVSRLASTHEKKVFLASTTGS